MDDLDLRTTEEIAEADDALDVALESQERRGRSYGVVLPEDLGSHMNREFRSDEYPLWKRRCQYQVGEARRAFQAQRAVFFAQWAALALHVPQEVANG